MAAQTFSDIAKARGLIPPDRGVEVRVEKAAAEQRLVFGWASITTQDGAPVVDVHGDSMPTEVLEKAAYRYTLQSRAGKRQHAGEPVMHLVESVVLTKAKQDAMGVDLGREGWWVGFHVPDDATWGAIKSGDVTGFSIGGRGVKVSLES